MDRFVAAYENGATPNPCIDCNRYLKFNSLYHRAEEFRLSLCSNRTLCQNLKSGKMADIF